MKLVKVLSIVPGILIRQAMFIDVESYVGEIEHTDPNIGTQTLRL